ncbi:MAG: hypothetical protein EOP06_29130 [Proteobacteria bacterium]|nr:MAG: hypothetical protein EOP06_29130 [Pseudomonadota bacterium]
MTVIPVIFGFTAFGIFSFRRAKKRKLTIWDGFLGWLLLIIFVMIGDAVARELFSDSYRASGDNPSQVFGFSLAILFSLFICPMVWVGLRRRL